MRRRAFDRAIVAVARQLPIRGLVVGTAGNVSGRVGDMIRITPTHSDYAAMRPSDLVSLDVRGKRVPARASLEWRLHAAIYRERPDIQAIVHAHPPCATAWSCLGEPLLPKLEESDYYRIGPVRIASYAPGGSVQLAEAAAGALGGSRAVLLARHGVVVAAETPAEALRTAEAVEHEAFVALLVRMANAAGDRGCSRDRQRRIPSRSAENRDAA